MGRKIRLACLIGQLNLGGTEKQLYYFLENCDRSLIMPEVWTFRPNGKWEERIRALDINIIKISAASVFNRVLQIRKFAVKGQFDLVWSWSYFTNSYLSFLPSHIHTIGSLRGSLSYCRKSVGYLFPLCEIGFKTMIVNSSELVRELEQARYRGQVIRIGNMMYPYSITNVKRSYWRRRFGCEQEDRLIVGVGRLDKNKNFSLLIQSLLGMDVSNLRVVIVGDGPEKTDLQGSASKLGLAEKVFFPGEIQDAIEIIASSDLLVHPSLSEGLSNVVAEAVVACIPVVSTCVNGLNDLIPSDDYGWRVPLDDVLAMRLAIEEALTHSNDAIQRAKMARTRAINMFHPNLITRQIEKIISNIVKNG